MKKQNGKTPSTSGAKTAKAITVIPPEDYRNIKDAYESLAALAKWYGGYTKWWHKYGEELDAPQPLQSTLSLEAWSGWFKLYFNWLKKYKSGGNPPPPPPPIPPNK